MRKSFYIIDGTALLYRSYFAFIKNPLINSKGQDTGGLYAFINSLNRLLEEKKPEYLAITFDSREPTFRHQLYREYKATREKMPEELVRQIPYLQQIVAAFNIKSYAFPGFESDDLMATLARKGVEEGFDIFLVTGDKDMMQLVSDQVKVLYTSRDNSLEIFNGERVKTKYGVEPSKIRYLLALMGDSSDNIPGITGIGEKKALKYLAQFNSLEEIYANPEKIENDKDREKFIKGKELAELSLRLVLLDDRVPLDFSQEEISRKLPDNHKLKEIYQELEFNTLINKLKFEVQEVKVNYRPLTDDYALNSLIERIKAEKFFVYDTETDGLDYLNSRIVGISFSLKEKEAFYLPLNLSFPDLCKRSELLSLLKPVFEDPEIRKGGQNTKFDMHMLRNEGIEVKGIVFDTLLAASVIAPNINQKNLDFLSLHYLNFKKIPTEELIGKGKNQISMAEVPLEKISRYACEDADITLRLKNLFENKLEQLNLLSFFRDLEIPLIEPLLTMERNGVTVDILKLKEISDNLAHSIKKLEELIYFMASCTFNINSPKQLAEVLYEKLKIHERLKIKRIRKNKTGFSTDIKMLELMREEPLIENILEFRRLSKLKSTYADALPALINKTTGKIHTSFNQFVTATGRLSSTDPNLQNIPIKGEEGKLIRSCFIPSSKDYCMVSADYSQIELRILAHLSEERALLEAFEKNQDIHATTAAVLFDLPLEKITKELRSHAKTINFGILYGMGAKRLSEENDISLEKAKEFIENYFQKYSKIKAFIENQINLAKNEEKVFTISGRFRPVPEINNSNKAMEVFGEHIAVNTPVQGSAADLIKIAMINIHKKLPAYGNKAVMILQVHDELVFEVHREILEPFCRFVKYEMENALSLKVPLKVEIGKGLNWWEAHL